VSATIHRQVVTKTQWQSPSVFYVFIIVGDQLNPSIPVNSRRFSE
jgi:hypothetical protein